MQTTDMTQEALEASIQAGESDHVEFKRNVKSEMARELGALANSSGGRFLIALNDTEEFPGVQFIIKLKARFKPRAGNVNPPVSLGLEALTKWFFVKSRKGRINRIVVPMGFTFVA